MKSILSSKSPSSGHKTKKQLRKVTFAKRLFGFAVCTLALTIGNISTPLFAQSTTADVIGTVTDSSGGVVPGAEVKVTGIDNGLVRSATTNDLGAYSVTELPGGSYSVAVSKTGYKAVSL